MYNGIVYCSNKNSSQGKFIFKSGQIRNNSLKVSNPGAAVLIDKEASFVMTGGTISGNNTGYYSYGAGVYVNGGLAEIRGGAIRDNTATVGSAIYYTDSNTSRSEKRGVILSGGQVSGNHSEKSHASDPIPFSPIYVGGPNFQLQGGGCDVSDSIYLNDIRNHIIISGDIYQSGRHYLVYVNQGSGENQFRKGSTVVAPDGIRKTDVTGYLSYFTVASNPYVLDRGQSQREIVTGGNIKEDKSLLLMRAVYLDGENGKDTANGNTPRTAVKTFSRAKSVGKTVIGQTEEAAEDYYIIYICGKVTNTEDENEWGLAAPAYMCRYTGFTVYKADGKPVDEINRAYYGYLVEPQRDLIINRLAIYGRRSIDSQEYNGDSLFMIPDGVTVKVQAENGGTAVFGRNYNVGQYIGEEAVQGNLSSQGGAFQVSPGGTLDLGAGRIAETEATFGKAIYLGADPTNGEKTGHLILRGNPTVSGDVYLDGNGVTSAAYIEPQDGYMTSGKLSIAVRNDYNGRECVRYPAEMKPGADELEHYSFEDSIYGLYDVVYRDKVPNIIELNQKTALYLDGVNGDDDNNGTTPATAFRTLKKLYEHIAQQQKDGAIISKGVAVYIVGTVTLDMDGAQDVMLNNVLMKDPGSGKKYYKGYYQDASTSQITVDGQVYFKRYAKPKAYDSNDQSFNGYGKETMTAELFHVKDGANLTLRGIYLDGHSVEMESGNKLYAADGVRAEGPLVTVESGGLLNCQYAAVEGNIIATMTLFLNNINVNQKDKKIGAMGDSEIYEGSSAGIELLEGGKCVLNHTEFRNLYLGDNITAGGTDIYHNGAELHFYNLTLFTGTVFLEGQGMAGKENTYNTSRFLYADQYGNPVQYNFQILMRDPYEHRTVVSYPGESAGPDYEEIGVYLLEESTKKSFYLAKREGAPWILELRVPSAVYIDGQNGTDNPEDPKAGSSPANPVKSLKRAYELLNERAGNAIIVVGTVQIDGNTRIAENQYAGTDGQVTLRSTDRVHFVRYIQPDFARGSLTAKAEAGKLGFDVDDFKGVLLNVHSGSKLTVSGKVYLDGHSEENNSAELPRERVVTRKTTSMAPLMTVEAGAAAELLNGSTLHNNNNIFDAQGEGDAADGSTMEGGAIYNRGTVTVNGALFENNHAEKGDAVYQAGTFTVETGIGNLAGHSFYLAADNRGTDESPSWEDHVLQLAEKVPEGQTFEVDLDHAAAGRDVIAFTSSEGYAPAEGADAEHEHFVLGSTVPDRLFLVEAEDDPAVLELQDWRTLDVEVPANMYLAVTRKGDIEESTKLSAVQDGAAKLFGTPEYKIINRGQSEVKVSLNGMDNLSASAGIKEDAMSLKDDKADVIGEKDIYLALKGMDSDGADGFAVSEIPLTDGQAAPIEMGCLKPGSIGTYGLTGKAGKGFVNKYKDPFFPLTDPAADVRNYMDGNGKDGLIHAKAKYLLKYKVEMVPTRRYNDLMK